MLDWSNHQSSYFYYVVLIVEVEDPLGTALLAMALLLEAPSLLIGLQHLWSLVLILVLERPGPIDCFAGSGFYWACEIPVGLALPLPPWSSTLRSPLSQM